MFLAAPPASKQDLRQVREKQAIARANLVRMNGGYMPESGYLSRKAFFTAKVLNISEETVIFV